MAHDHQVHGLLLSIEKFSEHSPMGKGSPSALTNAVLKMDTQPTVRSAPYII